ncbi:phage protein Gp36 family protein [Methylocystis sp. S23]
MPQELLTVDEFVARIGATMADDVAGSGLRGQRTLDTVKLSGAIGYTEALVVGYLAARYKKPFDPVPDIVKGWVTDIALYRLRYKVGDTSGVAEQIKQRYEDAMEQLRDAQKGRLVVDPTQGGVDDQPAQETPVLYKGRPSRADEILDSFALSTGGGIRRS